MDKLYITENGWEFRCSVGRYSIPYSTITDFGFFRGSGFFIDDIIEYPDTNKCLLVLVEHPSNTKNSIWIDNKLDIFDYFEVEKNQISLVYDASVSLRKQIKFRIQNG